MVAVKKGDEVKWQYGESEAKDTVDEVHKEDIEKTVQGAKVEREGSSLNLP